MAFRPPEFSIFKNTGWITYRNFGASPIMEQGEVCYTLQTTKMDEIADLAIKKKVIFYT
jgi:hypothetical protein